MLLDRFGRATKSPAVRMGVGFVKQELAADEPPTLVLPGRIDARHEPEWRGVPDSRQQEAWG
jgi:hypothetical protein